MGNWTVKGSVTFISALKLQADNNAFSSITGLTYRTNTSSREQGSLQLLLVFAVIQK